MVVLPTGSPLTGPQLPLEIWTRIIATVVKHEQIGRLWLTARRVSRQFKAATEAAFVQQHLRAADITYKLGWEWTEHGKYLLAVHCDFDRLSHDGQTAFFRDRRCRRDFPDDEAYEATVSRWREQIAVYLGDGTTNRRYDLPPHVIALRSLAMDTELVGLKVDFAAMEISFEWKKTLSMFFGEVEYIRAIEALEFSQEKNEIAKLKNEYSRSEVGLSHVVMNGLTMMENINDRVSKRTRRLRFRRWYEKHGKRLNRHWFEDDYDEREKLRELRQIREAGLWAEMDDDDTERAGATWPSADTSILGRSDSDKKALALDIDAYYADDQDYCDFLAAGEMSDDLISESNSFPQDQM